MRARRLQELATSSFFGKLTRVRYAINDKLVTYRVLDDGAVLVNHETGHYYTLNTTGTFLWEQLAHGERTRAELIAAMAQEFEQDESTVDNDVRQLLDELTREQLLVVRR